jgi:hypothetical protein
MSTTHTSIAEWRSIIKGIFRILGILVVLVIVVLIVEWVYSEIKFQVWLSQDEKRIDFSTYDNAEELRQDILAILPLGSSEEEVQAFRIANGFVYRKPTTGVYSGTFGVGMVKSQAGRGFFGFKKFILPYKSWGVSFILNPDDHTLIDISVISQAGI